METRYLPLFVYGTLAPGSRGYGSSLSHAVRHQARAFLPDSTMYITSAFPLVVRDKNGKGTLGSILLIEEALFDDVLFELDDFEGYVDEGRTDNLYVRSVSSVEILDTDQLTPDGPWQGQALHKAYVYFAAPETMERLAGEYVRSPSGDWANHGAEWALLSDNQTDTDDLDDTYTDADDIEELADVDGVTPEDELLENEKPKFELTQEGTLPLDSRNFRKRDQFDPDDELITSMLSDSQREAYLEASYNEDDEA